MQVGKKQLWEAPRDYLGDLNTTGKGVGIVVMDQGFDVDHPDLKNQIATCVAASAAEDIFDSDPVGHGTHVLGIVGGDGSSSGGRIQGVAPGARLIPIRMNLDPKLTSDQLADSFARNVYWAIQHKEEFNIRVMNCSFVLPPGIHKDATTGAISLFDPLSVAIRMATEAGISIVAGVGNFADTKDISTPAANPQVIAVGALDTAGTPQDVSDDSVAPFSSFGNSITGAAKPDLVAPGVHIMSTNAADCELERRNRELGMQSIAALKGPFEGVQQMARELIEAGRLPADALRLPEAALRKIVLRCFPLQATEGKGLQDGHPMYLAQDGSSLSAPIVTGVIAHMVEANPALRPEEIKAILLETAQPVAQPHPGQGRGAVNARAAIEEARRRAAV